MKNIPNRSQSVEAIRRRFRKHPEWLLIRVDTTDPQTLTPLTGRLLAHSPEREVIYKASMKIKGGRLMIKHSQPVLPPENYAFAF